MRPSQRARVLAAAGTTAAAIIALIDIPVSAQPNSANAGTTELVRLAQGYLQQRADMLTTTRPTVAAATARVRATPAMAARMKRDFTELARKGERYEALDGGYTRARVDTEDTHTAVDGRSATLRVTEYTRLYLPFSPGEVEEGAPQCEELTLPHTIDFTRNPDGAWLLASDEADDTGAGAPTPATQAGGG